MYSYSTYSHKEDPSTSESSPKDPSEKVPQPKDPPQKQPSIKIPSPIQYIGPLVKVPLQRLHYKRTITKVTDTKGLVTKLPISEGNHQMFSPLGTHHKSSYSY
jgi:hypothetical protein